MRFARITACGVLGIVLPCAAESMPPPDAPRPPSNDWKWSAAEAYGVSVDSAKPFDLKVHKALSAAGLACAEELSKAVYEQDVFNAFKAEAHFDNCAFDEGAAYIESLLQLADQAIAFRGRPPDESVRKAMSYLGQALHGIQDFYAHSNYVERSELNSSIKSVDDIAVVDLWSKGARKRISELRAGGLVSGTVWWNGPKRCPPGAKAHSEMAKDSQSAHGGQQSRLTSEVDARQSLHTVAYQLAQRASREFLAWSATRWPQIRRVCGNKMAFIHPKDRRQADIPKK